MSKKSLRRASRLSVLRKRKLGPTDMKRGFQPLKCRGVMASGNVIGIFGSSRDITARKLGEKNLKVANEAARES